MGPATTNEEISTSTIKVINLPKLVEDGSNWVMYQERVENAIMATKGLRRHLLGTARKPETLEQKEDGKWYKPGSTVAMSEDDRGKHEETVDTYEQREAQVCEFIYIPPNQRQQRHRSLEEAHCNSCQERGHVSDRPP